MSHSSKRGADKFINKCIDIRNKFDTGECQLLYVKIRIYKGGIMLVLGYKAV